MATPKFINKNNNIMSDTLISSCFNLLRGLLYDKIEILQELDIYYENELKKEFKLIPLQFLNPLVKTIEIIKLFYNSLDNKKIMEGLSKMNLLNGSIGDGNLKKLAISSLQTLAPKSLVINICEKLDVIFRCCEILLANPMLYLARLFRNEIELL
jgi:hypothetical protein